MTTTAAMEVQSATAPSETQQPTIGGHAARCLQLFGESMVDASAIHPRELSSVEDKLARFSAWTSGMGVFAPARASMDHRLRNAPAVHSTVIALLESLEYYLQNCSETVKCLTPPPQEDNSVSPDGMLTEWLGHAAAEISRLHKLSNLIRRSSKEVQNTRANEFLIEDSEKNDLAPTLLGHFKHHIRDRFPGLSDGILDRLANSMLLRRRRILYRRSRQPKHAPKYEGLVLPKPIMIRGKGPTKINPTTNISGKYLSRASAVQSQTQTVTTLAPEAFQRVSSTPSFISQTKTISFGNHEALIFPPAPGNRIKRKYERLKAERQTALLATLESLPGYQLYQEHDGEPPMDSDAISWLEEQISAAGKSMELDLKRYLEGIGEITCPYCFYAFPVQDVFDDHRWQSHVKSDLDPYICLFETCNQPDQLYSRSEEWLKHMHTHTMFWRCRSHGNESFSTREAYMSHVRQVHQNKLSDTQLRVLADRNARRISKLFESCPLCGKDDVPGDLQEHIVGHLRSLALKSLPTYEENMPPDENGEDGVSSVGSFKPQTRSTIKDFWDMEGDGWDATTQNGETDPIPKDVPFFIFGETNEEIMREHLLQASSYSPSITNGLWKLVEEAQDSSYDPDTDSVIRSMLQQQGEHGTKGYTVSICICCLCNSAWEINKSVTNLCPLCLHGRCRECAIDHHKKTSPQTTKWVTPSRHEAPKAIEPTAESGLFKGKGKEIEDPPETFQGARQSQTRGPNANKDPEPVEQPTSTVEGKPESGETDSDPTTAQDSQTHEATSNQLSDPMIEIDPSVKAVMDMMFIPQEAFLELASHEIPSGLATWRDLWEWVVESDAEESLGDSLNSVLNTQMEQFYLVGDRSFTYSN